MISLRRLIDMKKISPAISVVIPMYNAEKYIGDCLESILAQTFEDFEVIVVNNCSTDNSKKIVESYIPKFYRGGGQIELKVIDTKYNTGTPGIPTGIGVRLSRGKYIYLIDSDDLITKTALEELYNLAEKYQAEVVHCEKFFQVPEDWQIDDKREPGIIGFAGEFVTEPTLVTENFAERVESLRKYQFFWPLWLKFIRRDFLAENNIEFTNLSSMDFVFTCCLVCSAKKYLRVPNIVNIYRVRDDSISHKVETKGEVLLELWVKSIAVGFECLEKFLGEQEYFQKNLDAKYLVYETMVNDFSNRLFNLYAQFPAPQFDVLIQQEFAKYPNLTPLTTFIFSRMCILNMNVIQQQNLIRQQQELINQLQG